MPTFAGIQKWDHKYSHSYGGQDENSLTLNTSMHTIRCKILVGEKFWHIEFGKEFGG